MRILYSFAACILLAAVTMASASAREQAREPRRDLPEAAFGREGGQQQPPALVSIKEVAQGLPADGSSWLTFGGDYNNHRHSPLTQITPANVARLRPLWTFQTGAL